MKLNEIVYAIHGNIRPKLSDDSILSVRETEFHIHNQRALHLRNELNRNRTIDQSVIQTLGCVELVHVDRSECIKCGISVGCDVIRTKEKIPVPLELHNKNALISITYNDVLAPSFNIKPGFEQLKFTGHGRFNKNQIYTALKDGYVYIVSNNKKIRFLKHIGINGVFSNPIEVEKFKGCNGKPCFDRHTMDYPIQEWMVPRIEEYVLQKYTGKIQMPVDNTNDANNDIQTGQKTQQ